MPVVLSHGEKITFDKDGTGSGALGTIRMGLGWESVPHLGHDMRPGLAPLAAVDLDASCLMFDADHHLVDAVWARELVSKDGAVRHTGDSITGGSHHDDESIVAELSALPLRVTALVFTVSSFSGVDFTHIKSAYCRLLDHEGGDELARFDLEPSGDHNAKIMAKVARNGHGWSMTALGVPAKGQTFGQLAPQVLPHL